MSQRDPMSQQRARKQNRPLIFTAGFFVVASVVGLVLSIVLSPNKPPCTKFTADVIGARSFPAPPCMVTDANHLYLATIETSVGNIEISMEPRASPKSVNNFVFLARARFYDNTTFYRVDNAQDHAVIQAGDPAGTGRGGPGYTFKEPPAPLTRYVRGVVAMASALDAPGVNGSQFFIVARDWLALGEPNQFPTETFLGKVPSLDAQSYSTIDKIATASLRGTTPVEPITIRTVTIEELSRNGR